MAHPVDAVPMICIRGVKKHFSGLHVLKDINLDIGWGEAATVFGPPGSGQSTLCRTINRPAPRWSESIATCSGGLESNYCYR